MMSTVTRSTKSVHLTDAPSEKELILQGAITDEIVDSDGEVILADGLDRTRADAHLALINGHINGNAREGVGALRRLWRKGNAWHASFLISKHERILYDKAKDKILQFSIGFDIYDQGPPTAEERVKWPGAVNIIRQWALCEVSLVTVPANIAALIKSVKTYEMSARRAASLSGMSEDDIIKMVTSSPPIIGPAREIRVVSKPTRIVIE